MKQEPHTNPEYDAFDSLLRRVVSVPHSEIKREEEYKAERAPLKKKRKSKASRGPRRKS
jgi:hypothetical protein